MREAQEGWVIYAKPGEEPRGIKGQWKTAPLEQLPQNAFVVQPWKEGEFLHYLEPFSEIVFDNAKKPAALEVSLTTYTGNEGCSKEEFEAWINAILERIEQQQIEKCVAARAEWNPKVIDAGRLSDYIAVLMQKDTSAMRVCLSHPLFGVWAGLSPEVFCAGSAGSYYSMSLAGTVTQQQPGFTAKESLEQNIVTSYIRQTLTANGAELVAGRERPATLSAGHLTHLMNQIYFECDPENLDKVLKTLHPTPAVGGFPKHEALLLIDQCENLNRELYSGWWGIKQGDGVDYYVNLRCARLYANGFLAFAGCGVNEGSVPGKEWEETVQKMRVIKGVLNG